MVRFASLLSTGLGLTLAAAFSPEPTIEISDGVYMPYVSLGHPDDGNVTEKQSLELWLKLGGVGVDTAYDYMNQNQVGAAIAASGRARDSIFVTTKIPNPVGRAKALAYVKEDLKEMNLDFADLILIHSPCTEGFPEAHRAQDAMLTEFWIRGKDLRMLSQ